MTQTQTFIVHKFTILGSFRLHNVQSVNFSLQTTLRNSNLRSRILQQIEHLLIVDNLSSRSIQREAFDLDTLLPVATLESIAFCP